MTEYCSDTDIKNRLTRNGYKFVADRDRDAKVSDAEKAAYITEGIQYAGSILDMLVENKNVGCLKETARAQAATTCLWLKHRAVDIAVWWATSSGGRTVPEAFQIAHDNAMQQIRDVEMGATRIPGLIYQRPSRSCDYTARLPKVHHHR